MSAESPDSRRAGDSPFDRVRLGDPHTIAKIARLVAIVVNDRGYGIPPADRPDVIQNALLDIWRALARPGFKFDGRLETFARTVAYRRCVDWMRRQHPVDSLEDRLLPSRGASPDRVLLWKDRLRLGAEILARLSQACRELFELRVVGRLRHGEIARRQRRSEEAVRAHFYKCVKAARRFADQLDPPGEAPRTGS